MTFIDSLKSRMMPRGADPRGIFAPPGANGPVKFWDLAATYDGPFSEQVLTKLEEAGKVAPGTAERAASGAGHAPLWGSPEPIVASLQGGIGGAEQAGRAAAGTAGGAAGGVAGLAGGAAAAAGGAAMVPVNPIYQSPLYASLGFSGQVNVPMMAADAAGSASHAAADVAGSAAASLVDDAAGLVDDVAPLAADLTAGGAAAGAHAMTAEQVLMQGFEHLSGLPNVDRPGILAAAIDTRAAAGKGVESFDVLTRALLDGPMEDSAPALRSAIDSYAAKVIEGAGGLAPAAAKVAEGAAPAAHLLEEAAPALAKAAAEFASPAARAFAELSPTMAAVVRAAGPIELNAIRGASAFVRPLESSTTACLTGVAELMTRVHL
ncbi:MAG: hypothetical protein JWN72_2526 [Thermoleophilia bacterium]|nr:hypothetical protein [Thermoleophilia bacterium]